MTLTTQFKPESGGAKCLVTAAPLASSEELPPLISELANPIFLRIAAGRMQRAALEHLEEDSSRA